MTKNLSADMRDLPKNLQRTHSKKNEKLTTISTDQIKKLILRKW